jgi:hypothetical protein
MKAAAGWAFLPYIAQKLFITHHLQLSPQSQTIFLEGD